MHKQTAMTGKTIAETVKPEVVTCTDFEDLDLLNGLEDVWLPELGGDNCANPVGVLIMQTIQDTNFKKLEPTEWEFWSKSSVKNRYV